MNAIQYTFDSPELTDHIMGYVDYTREEGSLGCFDYLATVLYLVAIFLNELVFKTYYIKGLPTYNKITRYHKI